VLIGGNYCLTGNKGQLKFNGLILSYKIGLI